MVVIFVLSVNGIATTTIDILVKKILSKARFYINSCHSS